MQIDTIHCLDSLETGLYRTGIRESYRTTNSLANSSMTCFTGKPLARQTPLVRFSPRWHFRLSVGFLILIPFLTMLVGKLGIIPAVLMGYVGAVLQTGLFRIFQVQFGHHASHKTFIRGGGKGNEFYLNLATTIALCQNGKEYRLDHKAHHSRKIFTTIRDPDAALLYRFGIRPGIDRENLFRRYLQLLISPRFHVFFLWNRIKSNFVTRESVPWRIFTAAWLALLCSSFVILPLWVAILTIWLPLTLFYQMSAVTQFITEHAWLASEQMPKDTSAYAQRCWGRFFGDPIPNRPKSPRAIGISWPVYLFRLFFLHFPGRYAVMIGDMPAHDWHHLAGLLGMSGFSWPIAIYERQRAIDEGDKFKLADRELWGLDTMLKHVFAILSRAPAQEDPTCDPAEDSIESLKVSDMDIRNSDDPLGKKSSLRKRACPT